MRLIYLPILLIIAALNVAVASLRTNSGTASWALKSAQIYALNFTKKTLSPIPGAASYMRDSSGLSGAVARNSRAAADSAVGSRIVGIREGGDTFRLLLDLGEDQHNISINAFNLLGKKVTEIYQGPEKAGRGKDYTFNVGGLPNGIYICVVQGDNFRLAEKFIISR
ncbi:hypothetical protein MASR2M18_19650 [Ignavibacteria bacterium]|jgi:hypothetical protein|nr:T9SS type A sorting domain-containing protein [Bacteroidota bacterium]MCZ2131618.1 T9SS type A sorting domain-containing protein [Bacteroidota bacterium]